MSDLIDTPHTPAPTPIWLERERPVFGVYHPPAAPRHPLAVLFCAPFGWEDMGSYPIRRHWAQRLADAGHPVLRFDLPGTGQSAGSPQDAQLVSQWSAATADAARWLRDQDGAAAVAAVGIGLGALLALHAAADGAAIDDLVLWGLPASGRALVRRMRAFAALQVDGDPRNDDGLPAGSLQTGGFVLSEATMADLSRMRADRVPAPRLRRVMLMEGAGPEGEAEASATLQAAGVEVHRGRGVGYVGMLDSPHLTTFPTETVAETTAWLSASREPGLAPASPPVIARAECIVEHDGVAIRERPLCVTTDAGVMFGVLAEPAHGEITTDTCVVCLPALAERCIGPSRLWVELARRHAARGIPSLRIDLLGVGDSDGGDEDDDGEGINPYRSVFDGERIGQVRRVLDALVSHGAGPRFTLVGLCSGAYWALNTAWIDERIHSLLLLNPSVSAQGHASIMRDAASRPLRKLLEPDTWRRLRHGEMSARGGAREALRGVRFLMAGPRRRPPTPESVAITDPDNDLAELHDRGLEDPGLLDATGADLAPSYGALTERIRERGGRIAFCVCRVEPAHRLLEIEGLLGTPVPGLIVVALGTHDHNLRTYSEQRAAHGLADDVLADAEGVNRASADTLTSLSA